MGAQWKAKHKEAAANARGKIFGRLVKEIMVADTLSDIFETDLEIIAGPYGPIAVY